METTSPNQPFAKRVTKWVISKTNIAQTRSTQGFALVGHLGLEPVKIIFHNEFSKTITTFNRPFSVLYKLTIMNRIKKVCYKVGYEKITIRLLKILHYTLILYFLITKMQNQYFTFFSQSIITF